MYDRLLKLIETEGKEPSWKKGNRVDPKHIRGNRTAPGMMGGMRGVLNTSINRRQGGPTPPKESPRAFDKLS